MKDQARWAACFLSVFAAHLVTLEVALAWHADIAADTQPPAAVMIELAPEAAAPEAVPNEAPPAPDLREAVPEPQEPPPIELKPPPIDIALAEPPPVVEFPKPDQVVIPLPDLEPPPPVELKPPPPKPRPVEKPRQPQPKPQQTAAAPQATPQEAPRAAAPAPGAAPSRPSSALPTWQGLLMRHLERHKRYPTDAQRQRQEGTVYLRFTLSRDGRVLASQLVGSSGVAALDQEGLDLLGRAQPMPPFPTDQPGEAMELMVPLVFSLRR